MTRLQNQYQIFLNSTVPYHNQDDNAIFPKNYLHKNSGNKKLLLPKTSTVISLSLISACIDDIHPRFNNLRNMGAL